MGNEEWGAANLIGMKAAEAKEYILALITTLKLTEKEAASLEGEAAKWKGRSDLARSMGKEELLAEAEKEEEKIHSALAGLRDEERSLKDQIEALRRQLPALAARERSIDADLLEQELLMALGHSEEEAKTDRDFRKIETDHAADAALEALKAKMNLAKDRGSDP